MLSKLFHTERGDTIVEVLIAIGIISLILVSAYAITAKNTAALQRNQERTEAQHLVEGQIEALRAQNGLTASGDCFNGTTEVSICNNFTRSGSGATYTVTVTGPLGHPATGVYTIKAVWTSLNSKTNNDSNVTMYYRLQ